MNLLDSLQSDILSSAPLSDVLRKAKVLAYRLKNQEFKDWVECEANGYRLGSPLPEYRVLPTQCFGTFTNGRATLSNVATPSARTESYPDGGEGFANAPTRGAIGDAPR